jgi:hypothetical protein
MWAVRYAKHHGKAWQCSISGTKPFHCEAETILGIPFSVIAVRAFCMRQCLSITLQSLPPPSPTCFEVIYASTCETKRLIQGPSGLTGFPVEEAKLRAA